MLLDCFAYCTRRLLPAGEEKAANGEGGDPAVPVPLAVEVAPESAPVPPQVPAAHDVGSPEPPFQTDLVFFTSKGQPRILRVTVDNSRPVNVVTTKCLRGLGFEPRQDAPPPGLTTLTADMLRGYCGWELLTVYAPVGHRGVSHDIDFVVAKDDDSHCDVLFGRQFQDIKFKLAPGIFPNYANPLKKEEKERQEKQKQDRKAKEAAGAAEQKRKAAERSEQLRKGDPKSGDGAGEGTSA